VVVDGGSVVLVILRNDGGV